MSNLEIIEALCQIVEQQAELITALAMDLQQVRNLTESEAEMIRSTQREYSEISGNDRISDKSQI